MKRTLVIAWHRHLGRPPDRVDGEPDRHLLTLSAGPGGLAGHRQARIGALRRPRAGRLSILVLAEQPRLGVGNFAECGFGVDERGF